MPWFVENFKDQGKGVCAFKSSAVATAALHALNGSIMGCHRVTCEAWQAAKYDGQNQLKEVVAMTSMGGQKYTGATWSGGADDGASDNLFMVGLPAGTTDETLKVLFQNHEYGTVLQCNVLPSPRGRCDATALVRMGCVAEAKWLVFHMNGCIPEGLCAPVMFSFAPTGWDGFQRVIAACMQPQRSYAMVTRTPKKHRKSWPDIAKMTRTNREV